MLVLHSLSRLLCRASPADWPGSDAPISPLTGRRKPAFHADGDEIPHDSCDRGLASNAPAFLGTRSMSHLTGDSVALACNTDPALGLGGEVIGHARTCPPPRAPARMAAPYRARQNRGLLPAAG